MILVRYIRGYSKEYLIDNFGYVYVKKGNRFKELKQSLSANKRYYSVRIEGKQTYVHQLIAIYFLNHKPNGNTMVVDHIDNNALNNDLSNIQVISHRENSSKDQKNRASKYIGVTWHKREKKWHAKIRIDGKQVYLGGFKSEEDAAKAYQDKLKEL